MVRVLFFIITFFTYSCHAEDHNSFAKDFKPFNKNQTLHFKHLCSEVDNENPNTYQSYAFFETNKPRALALGHVRAGWVLGGATRPYVHKKGIGFQLTKMKIESLTQWAGDSFTLSLQITNLKTNETARGFGSKTFFSDATSTYPIETNYMISQTGQFNWIEFIEPEENKEKSKVYQFSNRIYVHVDSMKNLEDEHKLYLILENTKSKQQIHLEGPSLNNIPTALNVKQVEPARLSLIEILTPGHKGGLFDWFANAFRYKKCIQLRKASKKQFDIRFNSLL